MEDLDENDLINLINPRPVINHHRIHPQQLKSAIKVPVDVMKFHQKYPSKIFQGQHGFIEPYTPEEKEVSQS